MNELAGAVSATAARRLDPARAVQCGSMRLSRLRASGRIRCRECGGSGEVPAATTQRWASAPPVVRSVLQIPSVACMVCRDGVAQHPPFGGGAPAAMGDGQQPHPTGGPRHSQCGDRKVRLIAIGPAGRYNSQIAAARAGYLRRCSFSWSNPGALHIHVMAVGKPSTYHQAKTERRLEPRRSHKTVGKPLASHCQRLSNENRGTAPCKLPLKQTESGSHR
jgi:hypothetical protein